MRTPAKPLLSLLLASALSLAAPLCARAHPHIFIDAEADITLGEDGDLAAISHVWTFDPLFSAWLVQGIDRDDAGRLDQSRLDEIARHDVGQLRGHGYYTEVIADGATVRFETSGAATMEEVNGRLQLRFDIVPMNPKQTYRETAISVFDPNYYTALSFSEADGFRVAGGEGCAVTRQAPVPLPDSIRNRLAQLPANVHELPPELAAAIGGREGRLIISCVAAGSGPAPARAAPGESAAPRPPFSVPLDAPSPLAPAGSAFDWLAEQQRLFHRALAEALDELRRDNRAFWVLGGLSFIYGVLHAAGPGHGKLVVSSYMLANERQLRRGIALSFLSAMMQSAVAVALVLLLAGALRLTSGLMSEVIDMVTLGSYGLIVLLGLWLSARKLTHPHRTAPHAHAPHHEPCDHCHHHVAPRDLTGGWREGFGVVLSVGLRPCSGALIVLVFAFSQDLLAAGIAATVLMGLGTGLTVALLAAAAVLAKGGALRLAGGEGRLAAGLLWWTELGGALIVLAFGLTLFLPHLLAMFG